MFAIWQLTPAISNTATYLPISEYDCGMCTFYAHHLVSTLWSSSMCTILWLWLFDIVSPDQSASVALLPFWQSPWTIILLLGVLLVFALQFYLHCLIVAQEEGRVVPGGEERTPDSKKGHTMSKQTINMQAPVNLAFHCLQSMKFHPLWHLLMVPLIVCCKHLCIDFSFENRQLISLDSNIRS